jgi:hypothetical protein
LAVIFVAVGCTRKGQAPPDAKAPATAHGGGAPTTGFQPPKTEDACRACNGKWGVHGIEQTPTCLCRTHDGRCRWQDECEGTARDAGEREVTQPGRRSASAGRCSEFHAVRLPRLPQRASPCA